MHKRSLYLDLDDVVAGYPTDPSEWLNEHWPLQTALPPLQRRIELHHNRYFRDLPLMPNARDLVNWATEFSNDHDLFLAFLTAIPKHNDMPYAVQDKADWCRRYFAHIPMFIGPYSTDKHLHCRPGDILIDDRPLNCTEWSNAGGIAHLYTTWEECQSWAESTLYPYFTKIYS